MATPSGSGSGEQDGVNDEELQMMLLADREGDDDEEEEDEADDDDAFDGKYNGAAQSESSATVAKGWDNSRMRMLEKRLEKDKKSEEEEREGATTSEAGKKQEVNRRIKYSPPGINIFTDPFLKVYSAKDLNIEADFKYKKRDRLKQIGIEDRITDQILGNENSIAFINFLNPDSCSALVSNESDFIRVCDYLFYYCSSCLDPDMFAVYEKALFDLLKNYEFRWTLRLKHVLTALENLGFNEGVLSDSKEVTDGALRDTIQPRINVVNVGNSAKQKKHVSLRLDRRSGFFDDRKKMENPSDGPTPTEAERLRCIKNFVCLVCNLVINCNDKTEFKPVGDDWIHQLCLISFMVLIGTDKDVARDSMVTTKILSLLHFQLDTFSQFQWTGAKNMVGYREESGNQVTVNACLDITDVILNAGSWYSDARLRTWELGELPPQERFRSLDHHHNMVSRLSLLPHSSRGNQVKKNVAFGYLQYLIDVDNVCQYARADITDVHLILNGKMEEGVETSPGYLWKMRALFDEHYLMLNVVRLIDVIAGNEATDYNNNEKLAALGYMKGELASYSRKLKDDASHTDASRVKEVISQATTRWKILNDRNSEFAAKASKSTKK